MEYHPGFQTLSSNPPAVPSISMLPINIKALWKHTAVVCCLYLNTWMCGIPLPNINVPADALASRPDGSTDPMDGDLTAGARDRHYQALHLCHSETMDEQTNFTQACIRSGRPQLLQAPSTGKHSYRPGRKVFANGDRASERTRGGEQEKSWHTCCLYATFLISTTVRTVSSTTQPEEKRTRSTLVFQTLCQKHTIRAILLQLTQHRSSSFGAEKC